jgi:uncharacterized protein YjiS (DUF1127 family)
MNASPETIQSTGARMTTLIRTAALGRKSRKGVLSRLFDMLALRRSRRSLTMLDDHLLRDIGLTRDQAQAEADRAAWDVAPRWRR